MKSRRPESLLTASRLKCARGCKREHHIKYNLGYRPVFESEDLFFGTLIHLGLEAWWLAVKAGKPEAAWLSDAFTAVRGVKCDAYDLVRAEAMLMGYDARWAAEVADYEVLAVEVQFRADVVNPETGHPSKTWQLGGKLDVLVRDRRDGRVRFVEHKTSSEDLSPGSVYWRKLRMDGQVSVYFDGIAALGHEAVGCIYDVLGKPAQRPGQVPVLDEHGNKVVHDASGERVRTKQGKWRQTGDTELGFTLQTRPETPDEYRLRVAEAIAGNVDRFFGRVEVVRLEADLQDARFDVWAMGRELRENELASRAQRNPDACERYGRMCPYFEVCTGAASLDDPRLFLRTDQVHPELAGVNGSDSEQGPKEVGT